MDNKHKLVIVESPAKAKTIKKILSNDYIVLASMGHIRDLPEKTLAVNIKNNFSLEYIVTKPSILKSLLQAAKNTKDVYLATDPDREGEAIAWHIKELLNGRNRNFFRVEFHEITKSAIIKAFKSPREINLNLVGSQQARRVLDRIVGYQLSPLLWSKIKKNISAGRVQSIALKMICDREKEIQSFIPKEYWNITASLLWKGDNKYSYNAKLVLLNEQKIEINDQQTAENICKLVKTTKNFTIDSVKNEITKRYAPPPFITSSMQQSAGTSFNYSPSKTMSIAQTLYEGVELEGGEVTGLITYMRTDSFTISKEAQDSCRNFISETFGIKYIPDKPNFFKNKSTAQEAHEAIRPTDVYKKPEFLKKYLSRDQYNLYKLIWNRFVASQMSPAEINKITVDSVIKTNADKYTFRSISNNIIFDGYCKLFQNNQDDNSNEDKDGNSIPFFTSIQKDDLVLLQEIDKEQKFTEPPPRYTEPSLIKDLETNGIGRPSTYATIVNTIQQRKYVSKIKGKLIPEELGLKVNDYLTQNIPNLMNINFTAEMEAKLDEIEAGKVKWTSMLNSFYNDFSNWLNNAKYSKAPEKEKVDQIFKLLNSIKNWQKPSKQGKRFFNDKKFYESIQEQYQNNAAITEKQWATLISLVEKYQYQIEKTKLSSNQISFINNIKEKKIAQDTTQTNIYENEDIIKILNLIEASLKKKDPNNKALYFTESLNKQASTGKKLTQKQLYILKKIVIENKNLMNDFNQIAINLGISEGEIKKQEQTIKNSSNIPIIISDLDNVKEWGPQEKKGKKVFDDKSFFESIKSQYLDKNVLSTKQIQALKKLYKKYFK